MKSRLGSYVSIHLICQAKMKLINRFVLPLNFVIIIWYLCNACVPDTSRLREYISLSGEWKFTTDTSSTGYSSKWFISGIPNSYNVNVPHAWNIDSLTENYYGCAWYEKEFFIPEDWIEKRVKLEFERVYHDAAIWVNGEKAGVHIGSGYTTFSLDISEYIMFGENNSVLSFIHESIP